MTPRGLPRRAAADPCCRMVPRGRRGGDRPVGRVPAAPVRHGVAVAVDAGQHSLAVTVEAVEVGQPGAQPVDRVVDPRPGRRVGKDLAGEPVRGARREDRLIVREVPIDGQAGQAGSPGKCPRSWSARGRACRAGGRSTRRSAGACRPFARRATASGTAGASGSASTATPRRQQPGPRCGSGSGVGSNRQSRAGRPSTTSPAGRAAGRVPAPQT